MASLGYIMIYLLESSLESKTHDQVQCRLVALLPRTWYPPNISCTRLVASDPFHHSCIHVSPQANHIQSRKPSGQTHSFKCIHDQIMWKLLQQFTLPRKTCNIISNQSKIFIVTKHHFCMRDTKYFPIHVKHIHSTTKHF